MYPNISGMIIALRNRRNWNARQKRAIISRTYLRKKTEADSQPIASEGITSSNLWSAILYCNYITVQSVLEHTYVRGRRLRGRGDNYGSALFPIETWNQVEAAANGIARTNNVCEWWHNNLQSLLQCSHPTMWRFLEGIRNDCVKQKAAFLQGVAGAQAPSEKRYRVLRERTMRAMATYGQTDVLTFLHAIAHLSYQWSTFPVYILEIM